MSLPTAPASAGSSTRPYLIRALHDWCTDNGFTPYVAVFVDASVRVPAEYVKNNEIVLNVGFEATSGLQLGNEFIEFKARFGGSSRDIMVPVSHVIAIYARENGQGMAFPMPSEQASAPNVAHTETPDARRTSGAAASHLALADASAKATPTLASVGPAQAPPDPPDLPEPPTPPRPPLKRIK